MVDLNQPSTLVLGILAVLVAIVTLQVTSRKKLRADIELYNLLVENEHFDRSKRRRARIQEAFGLSMAFTYGWIGLMPVVLIIVASLGIILLSWAFVVDLISFGVTAPERTSFRVSVGMLAGAMIPPLILGIRSGHQHGWNYVSELANDDEEVE